MWRTTEPYRQHVKDIAADVKFGLVRSFMDVDVDEVRQTAAGPDIAPDAVSELAEIEEGTP